MHRIKKLTAVILSTLTVSSVCVFGGLNASASGTGAGLAEYCLNAYDEGWSYVWGGTTPGAVDCSGLIWSYCGGNRMSMLSDAQENGRDWGYVSNGVPRVHGLGLSRPGHVGVYIEDGMEVDARGVEYGVCYQEIGGWNNWDCWFKLTAVTYPENGWEEFNGNYYYYEDGEYIVSTSREIDGTTYYFDSKGHSGTTPTDTSS
ncbi:MAG: C40 family peptidase, partial [Ruminococcus sp.]|nr:C40 family peptidase [Ruminococcus sp.]